MKKQLKINELKVKSFVTLENEQAETVAGGGSRDCLQTAFSCLAYVSCNPLDCIKLD